MKGARMLFCLLMLIEVSALAQGGFQYEFGFGGGLASYTGDVSRRIFSPTNTDRNVFLRSNRSSRFAFCIDYNNGKAQGSSQELNTLFPEGGEIVKKLITKSFTSKYQSIDILIEANFFPYPEQKTITNSSDFSPFYFIGLGVKQYSIIEASVETEGSGNTISIPIGAGFKWKFSEKWGIQYRFKAEKLFTDKFDGDFLNEPYKFNALSIHRQDFLYMNTLSLVYHFGQSKWDCNCNKDQRRKGDKNPL